MPGPGLEGQDRKMTVQLLFTPAAFSIVVSKNAQFASAFANRSLQFLGLSAASPLTLKWIRLDVRCSQLVDNKQLTRARP